jgi:hypothetical protein
MSIFNLTATKANINVGSKNEGVSLVAEMEGREQLRIDKEYLLARPGIFNIYGKDKKEVEVFVVFKRSSEANKRVKKDAVGIAYFFKEYEDNIDLTYTSASVHFEVYVEDKLYEKIYGNVVNKSYIKNIMITIDSKNLSYGFAPDGTEKEWDTTSNSTMLPISDFNITFSTERDSEEVENENEKKDLVVETLFKEIGQLKLYLSIVAAAAAIQILTRFFG